jgi:hypothetical protein
VRSSTENQEVRVSAKLSILPYHPALVLIEQALVRVRVARFTLEQFKLFKREFDQINSEAHKRPLLIRHHGDEEQVGDDGKTFVIPDDEIMRRRLAEMTPEDRATYEKADAAAEDFAESFVKRALTDYVTVEEGEIEITENGVPRWLTTGAELVEFFGARQAVLRNVLAEVYLQNTASDALKNVWRSRLGSGDSSLERDPEANGARPEPPVESVKSEGSAGSEAATASTAAISSGSTATLH